MNDEAGFTLIEALIALAILAGVTASAAVSFQLFGARALDEERSLRATLFARSALSAFDAMEVGEASRQGEFPQGGRWRMSARPIHPERQAGGLAISVTASIGRNEATLSTIRIVARPR